ncbi:MAG: CPBP family intramembrane metalloprotease [Bacteroidetes bacterium]|nr:CPBP family intramembrane metalloprotease [Bacteroidota bacterium]
MNITMNSYLKQKPAWMQLLIFGGITFIVVLIVSLLGFAIIAQINHVSLQELGTLKQDDYSQPQYAGIVKGLLVVQFFGFFLLPSLIFSFFADPKPLKFAGFKKPDRANFIFLAIIVILFSYLMVGWMSALNQQLVKILFGKSAQAWIEKGESEVNAMLQNILDMHNAKDLLVSLFLVGVMAAIGEELFFRGILQRIFIQIFKNPWLGILVTAAIFSAVHGQFLGFIPRWILGIILGALYWYSGSLWTSIIAHFLFNAIPIVLVYFKRADITEQKGGHDTPLSVLGIIALVIVIALLNYLRKNSLTTYAKVYEADDHVFTDFPDKPL